MADHSHEHMVSLETELTALVDTALDAIAARFEADGADTHWLDEVQTTLLETGSHCWVSARIGDANALEEGVGMIRNLVGLLRDGSVADEDLPLVEF